ncbi:type II toxin-antitoxin system prevent-host-death family antitoxin [Amycolatopsis sp. PS_44_ISF1]|uniref:type II toxin-antitoxin system Phd/YefM family antitoxin n=1 Tax=Amycolatopsis sp. PS_44_ISF1 TaxID=2974917 RepID=UPI0028DE3926|nr:type II toxin-antitoxin system prevent-host-death family antitoxin [Amycolatopsis sp. PS_44_ISF1]MDT8913964.1 type II toxin-antitoxin system prevent-host-death family antitoxin [Amycolatopsis sp. PS_44_ISF1]
MSLYHEITQRDLRNRSGEIMDAVEHGSTFVLTRSGTPIGELIPLRRRQAVPRAQFARGSEHAPAIDPERFRADVDAAVDDEVSDPYGQVKGTG